MFTNSQITSLARFLLGFEVLSSEIKISDETIEEQKQKKGQKETEFLLLQIINQI